MYSCRLCLFPLSRSRLAEKTRGHRYATYGNTPPSPTPCPSFRSQESALGRLSGSVLRKKRRGGGGGARNGKSPGKTVSESGGSAHDGGGGGGGGSTRSYGYLSMASMASTSSVGVSSEAPHTPGVDSNASDGSPSFRKQREGRAVGTAASTLLAAPKPSSGTSGAGTRRTHPPLVEPPWDGGGGLNGGVAGGSAQILGTRSARRNKNRGTRDTCDMS